MGSVVRIYPGPPRFLKNGELAQLGERLVCNQEVTGSIPVFSTSLRSLWELRLGKPQFLQVWRVREGLPRLSREATKASFLTTEYSAIGSFF